MYECPHDRETNENKFMCFDYDQYVASGSVTVDLYCTTNKCTDYAG